MKKKCLHTRQTCQACLRFRHLMGNPGGAKPSDLNDVCVFRKMVKDSIGLLAYAFREKSLFLLNMRPIITIHSLFTVTIQELHTDMGEFRSMARTQLAVIPFIMHQGQPLILMVTSRETRRWIVPKGWQEKKVTDRDQAGCEAFEEAGALGILSDSPDRRLPLRQAPEGRQGQADRCRRLLPWKSANCWMTGRKWTSGSAAG